MDFEKWLYVIIIIIMICVFSYLIWATGYP